LLSRIVHCFIYDLPHHTRGILKGANHAGKIQSTPERISQRQNHPARLHAPGGGVYPEVFLHQVRFSLHSFPCLLNLCRDFASFVVARKLRIIACSTRRDTAMNYRYWALALALVLYAKPSFAFESRNPERDDRRLKIELDVVPTPPQQDFEQYVQALAAASQRDAREAEARREESIAKNNQVKTLNPLVLFRW
jgi:hypothetical protein